MRLRLLATFFSGVGLTIGALVLLGAGGVVKSPTAVAPGRYVYYPGTEDLAPTNPFFSPDGQWIGFWSTRNNQLQKIALTGGATVTLSDAEGTYGAAWGADDTIVFGQTEGIFRVAGAGGTPELVIPVDAQTGELARDPQILPGGQALLFTLGTVGGGLEHSGLTHDS